MSKTRDTGFLANVIQVHDTGVRIMSGSEMLMAISSSGQVTITGELSGSDAANALLLDGTGSLAFTTTSSFLVVSASQQQISSSLLQVSASYISLSASYTTFSGSASTRISNNETSSNSLTNASASFSTRITSDSSSLSSRTTQVEKTYATTGSNTYTGTQNFSSTCTPNGFNSGASIYTAGGLQVTNDAYFSSSVFIKGNVTVYGTQSVAHISSSQLNIGTNTITVNTFTPSVRFGGLSVFDSGSTGLTGSIFWDSELNRWIYVNASGSGGGATYGGGMFISGPRNTQGMGCEQGTTACMLMVGQGGDHMTSSLVYHDSAVTCIGSNASITSGGVASFAGNVSTETSYIKYGTSIGSGPSTPTYEDVFTYISNGLCSKIQGGTTAGWNSDSYLKISTSSGSLILGPSGAAIFSNSVTAAGTIYTTGGTAGDVNAVAIKVDNNKYQSFYNVAATGWAFSLGADTSNNGLILANCNMIFGTGASATEKMRITCTGDLWFTGRSTTANYQSVFYNDNSQFAINATNTSTGKTINFNPANTFTALSIASTGISSFSNTVCTPSLVACVTSAAAITIDGYSKLSFKDRGTEYGAINASRYNFGGESTMMTFQSDKCFLFLNGTNCLMFIGSNGNVGISTTNPQHKLDIQNGNLGIYYNTNVGGCASGAQIYLGDSNFQGGAYACSAPGIGAVYAPSTLVAGDLAFFTYTGIAACRTERMRIVGGNVGIGTTIPYAKLHVAGTIYSNVRCNTIDTDDGISNNFQGYGGYWALRTDESNRFNLDVYNSGTPITALQLSLAGAACFSGQVCATSGIKFGSGASTLNYYEQGTWTPRLRNGSFTTNAGTGNAGWYTRIGNLVTVGGTLDWGAGSGAQDGNSLQIACLPFASSNTSGERNVGQFGAPAANSIGFKCTGKGQVVLVNDPGASFIYLIETFQNGTYATYIHDLCVANAGTLYGFQITYHI